MKEKTVYVCGECGYETPRWMGKCPQCGSWNTIVEEERVTMKRTAAPSRAVLLEDVAPKESRRVSTGIGELDRVLGGGLVPGMTVLLGGSPGIGKSTLLLQTAHNLTRQGTVLYVSGEESKSQIRLRADRLGIPGDMLLLCETSAEAAVEEGRSRKAAFMIVDSIQTMFMENTPSAPGSVTQIRASAAELTRFAKETGTAIFLVGHVTKEGAIAGPKVLEHIVDTVLYFEGDKMLPYRILRAAKNRYGSTNELGMFDMTGQGLAEIENPSQMLLEGRPLGVSGNCVACTMEGSRPILSEIQALATKTNFPAPRRACSGYDYNRMNLLIAVLEKRAGYLSLIHI